MLLTTTLRNFFNKYKKVLIKVLFIIFFIVYTKYDIEHIYGFNYVQHIFKVLFIESKEKRIQMNYNKLYKIIIYNNPYIRKKTFLLSNNGDVIWTKTTIKIDGYYILLDFYSYRKLYKLYIENQLTQ